MKTIYKSILIVILTVVSTGAWGQKDTINRQVLLEREYNPVLQDATKIKIQPAIYTPPIRAKELNFVSTTPQISISNNRLGLVPSGDIQTKVDYDKKRGYVVLGIGSHNNIDAAAGYRVLNTDNDQLDIFAYHSSTNAMIDYLQKDYLHESIKAKYADTKAKLKYQHKFDPFILSLDASYLNMGYNYYGNTFLPKQNTLPFLFGLQTRQKADVISVGGGVQSYDEGYDSFKYKGSIRYQNFKSKYGITTVDQGLRGGQFDADVDVSTDFGTDKQIGVRGVLMNQSLNNKAETELEKIYYNSFTNITASPYFKFQGDSWDADLGLNINALFDVKNSMFISPNVKAKVAIYERNILYGELTGGVNNNTYLDILQENRYVNPIGRVEYSKTSYDAKIGFKSGVLDGFEFDLFGGYKHTKKDHLYLYSYSTLVSQKSYAWGNVATPLYADISTGHVGGLIKTTLIPFTTVMARMVAYTYKVKYADSFSPSVFAQISEKKAWGRPTFTMDLSVDVTPLEDLTLSVNYLLAAGRKTYFVKEFAPKVSSVENMKNINELSAKAEYRFSETFSFNARLNNILFQKYEFNYGYPMQGLNGSVGVNIKF